MSRIRVLVVDDSAYARKVIRECLARSAAIEVVGIARDGLEALEKIAELAPDVITLDLVMPNLDGLGLIRALPPVGGPRVVVVSVSGALSDLGIEALELGAVDIVRKPTPQALGLLYQMGDELVAKVVTAAGARPAVAVAPAVAPVRTSPPGRPRVRLLAIGASTGGPQALTRVLSQLPADLPVPVAVVLHLPAEYTGSFARRMDQMSSLEVLEADDGMALRPGRVVIARGGTHLRIASDGERAFVRLDPDPRDAPHRPSIDVLFESAADRLDGRVLGVVLTGMGNDGLRGARRIRAAGGVVLVESESSCVVYGMPRAVREDGQADAEAPIERMTDLILTHL